MSYVQYESIFKRLDFSLFGGSGWWEGGWRGRGRGSTGRGGR